MAMSAALAKLLTFGVLLILAVGLVMAGTSAAAAHAGPSPYADEPSYHVTARPADTADKVCESTLRQGDCSICCHDLGSSACCGHVVALYIEPDAAIFGDHHPAMGVWMPVARHGAHPQVRKRPPRLGA